MTTLQIRLPSELQAAAQRAVASGRYGSVEEYISTLIREDQERARRLEAELVRRIETGPATEMTSAHFDDIRRRLDAEIQRRNSTRA
jgi:putative addiction module CopG family antidote